MTGRRRRNQAKDQTEVSLERENPFWFGYVKWTTKDGTAPVPQLECVKREDTSRGTGAHNYCRNPEGGSTIWCYTTEAATRFDYCEPLAGQLNTWDYRPETPCTCHVHNDETQSGGDLML